MIKWIIVKGENCQIIGNNYLPNSNNSLRHLQYQISNQYINLPAIGQVFKNKKL